MSVATLTKATVARSVAVSKEVSEADKFVAAAWGINLWVWQFSLTHLERVNYRANVAKVIR